MLDMCSKPIFCSKIAQKRISCSKVAELNRDRPDGNENVNKAIYKDWKNQTRTQ